MRVLELQQLQPSASTLSPNFFFWSITSSSHDCCNSK